MKIKWLLADVTAMRSPATEESELFWVMLGDLGHFWPIQAAVVAGEPLCV